MRTNLNDWIHKPIFIKTKVRGRVWTASFLQFLRIREITRKMVNPSNHGFTHSFAYSERNAGGCTGAKVPGIWGYFAAFPYVNRADTFLSFFEGLSALLEGKVNTVNPLNSVLPTPLVVLVENVEVGHEDNPDNTTKNR